MIITISNQVTLASITIGAAPYKYQDISLGSPVARIATNKAPYQDGSSIIGAQFDETPVVIEGVIIAGSFATIGPYRRALEALLNPKDGLTLVEVNDSGTGRNILAVPNPGVSFPGGRGRGPGHQRFFVNLLAPNPLWYDPALQSETVVEGTPEDCENAGDWETPVTIVINGPCENPVVTNTTTGRAIKVNVTLAGGEELTITTAFGAKTTVLTSGGVDTNVMQHLDATDRDFWWLARGTNTINIADDAVTDVTADVSWYNKYLGV